MSETCECGCNLNLDILLILLSPDPETNISVMVQIKNRPNEGNIAIPSCVFLIFWCVEQGFIRTRAIVVMKIFLYQVKRIVCFHAINEIMIKISTNNASYLT